MAEASYDFFIAHAGADKDAAEELYDLLAPTAKVFLDSRSLKLGDDWDRALAQAQQGSRMTIVLVSEGTDAAFYQREEIAVAIDLARLDGSHRVVPLWLTPRKQLGLAVPYGLRVKHGVELSDDYPLERVAERLLKETATTPSASRVAEATSLDALFSHDPTISLPAAAAIAEHDAPPIAEIVDRLEGLNPVQIHTLRIVLAAFAQESAGPMVERIMRAGVDWHAATLVPECMSPAHGPYCADALRAGLGEFDPDVVRKCIEALGHVGVQVDYRDLLADRGYYYAKYVNYVLGNIGRAVALFQPPPFDAPRALADRADDFAHLLRVVSANARSERVRHGSDWVGPAEDVVASWPPRYADALLGWLSDELVELRQIGARGLGEMRLRRTVPHLAELAAGEGEADAVAERALWALGATGGREAVDVLEDLLPASGASSARARAWRWAVADCLTDASSPEQFERLARNVSAAEPLIGHRVYRAIGLRGDDRFVGELGNGLQDLHDVDRGAAALALARLGADGLVERLVQSYAEATGALDRVFTSLALLTLGEAPPGDPDLTAMCADLALDSYAWQRNLRAEILTVLRASDHPRSDAIADAWAPIYGV